MKEQMGISPSALTDSTITQPKLRDLNTSKSFCVAFQYDIFFSDPPLTADLSRFNIKIIQYSTSKNKRRKTRGSQLIFLLLCC